MTAFSKLLYKVGGYNPEIIKAGQLSSRYLLPGLSLLIVLITSCYGGWHLADIKTISWYRFPFTIGFVSLILLVDYLLLHGEKSNWTALMRVIVSATIGFIISILSTLQIFESDIIANRSDIIHNQTKTETAERIEEIAYWKSLVKDSIPKYDNLSTKAHKGDYVTDEGKKIPACSAVELEQSYCRTFARTRDIFQQIYNENQSKIINEENYIKGKMDEVIKRNPDGIIGQIENLWQLMLDKIVVFVAVILLFIFLTVIDLMPISVKYGIKDKLDADYEAKKIEIQTEKDSDGNALWYNSDKEKYFEKSQKQKIEIDLERIKQKNDFELSKFNEEALQKMNSLYALEKYQELLEYFKNKNVPREAVNKIFDQLHKRKSDSKSDEK